MNTLDFKITLDSEEQAEKLLLHFFNVGYKWPDGNSNIHSLDSAAFVVKNGFVRTIDKESYVDLWATADVPELDESAIMLVKNNFIPITEKLNAFINKENIMLGTEEIQHDVIFRLIAAINNLKQ